MTFLKTHRLILAFALLLSIFLSASHVDLNGAARVLLARALVERGEVEITDYFLGTVEHDEKLKQPLRQTTADFAYIKGEYYSEKAPGVALVLAALYAPFHALSEKMFGISIKEAEPIPQRIYGWFSLICIGVVCGVPLMVLFLFLTAPDAPWSRVDGGAKGILALVITSSTLFNWSVILLPHVPAGAFLVASFYYAFRKTNLRSDAVFSGIWMGLAILFDYLALVPCFFLFIRFLFSERERLASFCLAPTLSIFLLCYYHLLVTGSFFLPPYLYVRQISSGVERAHTVAILENLGLYLSQLFSTATAGNFFRLLFYPYKGFLFLSPFFVLALYGSLLLWREKKKALAILPILSFLFIVWLQAAKWVWWGWWYYGPRYAGLVAPLLLIPLCGVISRFFAKGASIFGKGLGAVLLGIGLFQMIIGLRPEVVLPVTEHPARTRDYVQNIIQDNHEVLYNFKEGLVFHVENFVKPFFQGGIEIPIWETIRGNPNAGNLHLLFLAFLWLSFFYLSSRRRQEG